MKEEGLTNREIAKSIAEQVYYPSPFPTAFAVQLFVERMVCPEGTKCYDEKEMEEWIFEKLEKL